MEFLLEVIGMNWQEGGFRCLLFGHSTEDILVDEFGIVFWVILNDVQPMFSALR